MPYSVFYTLGLSARLSNIPPRHNPFHDESEEYLQWLEGYLAGAGLALQMALCK
jgi:hypothetical protein